MSVFLASAGLIGAQAPPAAPPAPVSPGTLSKLFREAEEAFNAKNYDVVVTKIREILAGVGQQKDGPIEMLYFNVGLAQLLAGKYPEAEESFLECLKRYPKGEYASRCYLGIGRACIEQGSAEKKQRAVDALTKASMDPKYRSEAGFYLGEVYTDLGKHDEALKVFRSLMGSDIKTPAQTNAAVQVVGLLANTGKIDDLVLYLDRLVNQEGVRDAMAWYSNQVIVKADELVGSQQYEPALAIYRSVPAREQILSIQRASLESMRKDMAILQRRVDSEANVPIERRSSAGELLNNLKNGLEQSQLALTAIEGKADLDAALLMRRGRCLFYLDRYAEALICFRTLRETYETSPDAKSAAFAEIVIYNTLKQVDKLQELGQRYLQKYPDADNAEQVALLVGEILVQKGEWTKVGDWYAGLLKKFPQSANLDRYNFYQGISKFQAGDFTGAGTQLNNFLKSFPNSEMGETAMYYVVMANFLSNNYKGTLATAKDYLAKYPNGRYRGDVIYRLAFIESNDKDIKPEKIVRDLDGFLQVHPNDPAAGSMYTLLADTARKIPADPKKDVDPEAMALEAYKKALYTDSPDDVKQYALDSASSILSGRRDWAGLGKLNSEFIEKYPETPMLMKCIADMAKAMGREGKVDEANELIAKTIKTKFNNPTEERVELLLDELVKSFVPRRVKPKDVDYDAVDKQLTDKLNQIAEGQQNATTNARIYYSRARLAELLRRKDRSQLYLKGIASNISDPAALSPSLLAVVGDILLKEGKLDEAKAMYQRLKDRFPDSSYGDAGPVGLGQIALAKNKPEEALAIFNNAIENTSGMSRFKEAQLGKLESMVLLGQWENADKLADNMIGDKSFRGEGAGKAYLLKAKALRLQASKEAIDQSREHLKQAKAIYQRVEGAYKAVPEVYAEALWQEHEVAEELRDQEDAKRILEFMLTEPKIQDTDRVKDAKKKLNK